LLWEGEFSKGEEKRGSGRTLGQKTENSVEKGRGFCSMTCLVSFGGEGARLFRRVNGKMANHPHPYEFHFLINSDTDVPGKEC
jgi:hypothetical protein